MSSYPSPLFKYMILHMFTRIELLLLFVIMVDAGTFVQFSERRRSNCKTCSENSPNVTEKKLNSSFFSLVFRRI